MKRSLQTPDGARLREDAVPPTTLKQLSCVSEGRGSQDLTGKYKVPHRHTLKNSGCTEVTGS